MMGHATSCSCQICTDIRARALTIHPVDRLHLADAWDEWVSTTDGEAAKLRRGEDGAPGSPRWAALQAIARTRLSSRKDHAHG